MPGESKTTGGSRQIVIAGGGAAGVFAALACAQANPTLRVRVLERGTELLSKVRISGGGRCNVTHACFDPAELTHGYPRGSRELLGPFHTWQAQDTVRWFETRGVKLKVEPDGRMFPVSDSSQSIIRCLLEAGRQLNVEFRTRVGLTKAVQASGGQFELSFSDGTQSGCDRLLIATGGLKPGPILDLIRNFGHTIEPLAPSLFTFHIKDPRIDGLPGVSVDAATVSLPGTSSRQTGPVLITHWGLSGPAVLKLSAWGARWAQEKGYRFPCLLNWAPSFDATQAKDELERMRRANPARLIRKVAGFNLPARLWERLVLAAGIQETLPWSQLRRDQIHSLVNQLLESEFQVIGKSMFKEEFVTAGGVSLKEIQFKRMESRLVPGLFFAGEVLDIDGITGGFNFQSAWTTGVLAGRAMAS